MSAQSTPTAVPSSPTPRNIDDLTEQILEINRRLDAGQISPEHARSLLCGQKIIAKHVATELDAAKFTGRMQQTVRRWFPRVANSPAGNGE